MRILTVRQPWAWAIVHAGKNVENRSTNIAGGYRGPVAIHAGAAWDWDSRYPVGETPHATSASLVRGAIIGVVDLDDVHATLNHSRHPLDACSPWADQNAEWHLVLANPRPLAEPIPYTGALGLRTLDDTTVALIERQLA